MIIAMHGWSERWMCPDGVPLRLIDTTTGEAIHPVVCDANSGRLLDPRNIRWEVEAAPSREDETI